MVLYLQKRTGGALTCRSAYGYTRRPMSGGPRRNNAWSGMGTGWAIISILLGGMLVWGAVGYLIDRLAGTSRIFTGIGMLIGGAGGVYLVYLRYGRGDGDART